MKIDLSFRLLGDQLPVDHGYALYSSISHQFARLHTADWLAIHTINGLALGGRTLRLTPKSRLQLRLPPERLPDVLPLAGKQLLLTDQSREYPIRLAVPEVYALKPSPSLHSRCVVIKVSEAEKSNRQPDREMFLKALHTQMKDREIGGEVWIDERKDKQGRELSRRILHIKGKAIIGYAVRISGLKPDDSIKLQEVGLGGKQKMGCGIFIPLNIKGR